MLISCLSSEPLFRQLEADKTANFVFTQGKRPAFPPKEFEGYFGPPPNFTFVDMNPIRTCSALRTMPKGETPEDTVRAIGATPGWPTGENVKTALNHVIELIDADGTIEGVIGYSEGAGIAASLILEEEHRRQESGRAPCIKCAVFMAGIPPFHPVTGQYALADEVGQIITIPTCHVVGAEDKFIDGALALYNVCDGDQADLFDHGGGHIIPRDGQTLDELVDTIREMVSALKSN